MATATESLIEQVTACPLCGSTRLEELEARNLNSRDPARAARLAELVDDDFFHAQKLSVCRDCSFVFQSTRPVPEALERLYAHFAGTVAKVTPTAETAVEYFLVENSKDYVHMPSKALKFLDEHGLLNGVQSVLELRTYGGGLLAILRERGVAHIEGAYIQDFDAELARRLFGIEQLTPFSFARPLSDFEPALPRYDLILGYEALTHSRDPVALLGWIRDRLAPAGKAVLFWEPNTPAYREYMPLEIVFNNFHMNLLTRDTLVALVERSGGLAVKMFDDYHPSFPSPLYLNAVLRPLAGADAAGLRQTVRSPYGEEYYASWLKWDTHPILRPIGKVGRGLRRVARGSVRTVRTELAPLLRRPKS
jgi:hypothetical protein